MPKFQMRKPFRYLSPQEKLIAIKRVREGETKASVARSLNVPESTLRGWVKSEQRILSALQHSQTMPSDETPNEPVEQPAKIVKPDNPQGSESSGQFLKYILLQNSASAKLLVNNLGELHKINSIAKSLCENFLKQRDGGLPIEHPQTHAGISVDQLQRIQTFAKRLCGDIIDQRTDGEPLSLVKRDESPTKGQSDDDSSGCPQEDEAELTPEQIMEGLEHGFKFLQFLNSFTTPRITALHLAQLSNLLVCAQSCFPSYLN